MPIPAALLLALPVHDVQLLLIERQPVPGQPTSEITTIGSPTGNGVGGWAVVVQRSNEINSRFQVVGARSGDDAPGLLVNEGNYDGFWQAGFGSVSDLADSGDVAYTSGISSFTSDEAVYVDTQLVMHAGSPVPNAPGSIWGERREARITQGGTPWFVASHTTSGGLSIFEGFDAVRRFGAGDTLFLPDSTLTVEGGFVGSPGMKRFEVSPDGDQLLVRGEVEEFGVVFADVLSLDHQVVLWDGGPVIENYAAPAAVGAGLAWRDFFGIDVDSQGRVALGATVGTTFQNEGGLVAIDGVPRRWTGDVVDGVTILGDPIDVVLNDAGDWAAVFEQQIGESSLLFNGRMLLASGDPIDLTGDGTPDGTVRWTAGSRIDLTDDRRVLASYVVEAPGLFGSQTFLDVLFQFEIEDLSSPTATLSAAAGGTVDWTLHAPASEAGRPYLMLGSLTGTTPGVPLGVGTLPLVPDAYTDLLLSTAAAPITGGFGVLDISASASAELSLAPGLLAPLAGGALHHAFLVLDPAGSVSFVSDAQSTAIAP